MLDPFADALADLDVEFAGVEPLLYSCSGAAPIPIMGPWSEQDLLDGGRRVVYELAYSLPLASSPSTRDSFTHRGRRWSVTDVRRSDLLQRWELTVADQGAAA